MFPPDPTVNVRLQQPASHIHAVFKGETASVGVWFLLSLRLEAKLAADGSS